MTMLATVSVAVQFLLVRERFPHSKLLSLPRKQDGTRQAKHRSRSIWWGRFHRKRNITRGGEKRPVEYSTAFLLNEVVILIASLLMVKLGLSNYELQRYAIRYILLLNMNS